MALWFTVIEQQYTKHSESCELERQLEGVPIILGFKIGTEVGRIGNEDIAVENISEIARVSVLRSQVPLNL